ncbi:acetylcholine receptor subunit beta-type unc-29-like [Patiria miniata]|uniref:Uncharacterized protein n=1 Tax=Patiria miniata TaxID=46514 RepID=A0A914BDI6_PATMI|nr:acetylcholine receptor subunit beta-type unc-29-like [Patiria miniata]
MAHQRTTWLLLLSALLIISVAEASHASNDSNAYAERRLRQILLRSGEYDAKERPVLLSNKPVDVEVSMAMYALISLDEKEQVLKGASWIIMEWYDYRIHWDPEMYGNLRFLSLGMDDIWTPKILLTNTASEKIENPIQESVFRALASWDGNVTLEGPIIHETSCEMKMSHFPFDRQNCSLVISTQNTPKCIVNLANGPATRIVMNEATSQWQALNFTAETTAQEFQYKAYSKVIFYLVVKRLPYHYLLNIALPSAILTFISLGVFWLTPESGERISMAVSLLLGQAVFWLVTAESLPPTGGEGTPLLLDCIEYNFIVGGLAILLSVVTVGLQHQPGPLRGRFRRKLFLQILPLVVCLQSRGRGKVNDDDSRFDEKDEKLKMTSDMVKIVSLSDKDGRVIQKTKGYSNVDVSRNGLDDMKLVAAILDRLFFLVAAIIFTCGNVKLIACLVHGM